LRRISKHRPWHDTFRLISNFLIEYSWAVPGAFVVLVLGCVAGGIVAMKLDRMGARILEVAAAISAVAALVLAFTPTDFRAYGACELVFDWPRLAAVESFSNIALMPPLAFALTMRFRRPFIVIVGISIGSALIELVQAMIPVIGRACDAGDWEMNSIGAVLGAGVAWSVYTIMGRTRAADRADHQR
jgi:hypothetical protein